MIGLDANVLVHILVKDDALPVAKAFQWQGRSTGTHFEAHSCRRGKGGTTWLPTRPCSPALLRQPGTHAAFEHLAYSHQKEYADWIAGGKKPETRQSRAQKAVEMIAAAKRRT